MDSNHLKLTVETLPTGGFRATSADIPALDVQDDTIAGALESAQVSVRAMGQEPSGESSPVLNAARNSLLTIKFNVVDG